MFRRRLTSEGGEDVDINLSPMIDCVFILLIFFIVTTVFVEEPGIDVNKPEVSGASALDKNSILIAITAEGKVIYGGREIGVKGVGAVVRRLIQDKALPVIIQADERASHGVFAQVVGEAKRAGAPVVNFATKQE